MSSGFLLLSRYSDRGHQVDVSGIRLLFPVVGEVDISLVHSIQTDFGVRLASCPMVVVGCYSGGKTACT